MKYYREEMVWAELYSVFADASRSENRLFPGCNQAAGAFCAEGAYAALEEKPDGNAR